MIKDYLAKQQDLSKDDIESNFIDDLIDKAARYYNDFVSTEHRELALAKKDTRLICLVIDLLHTDQTAENLHNAIYEIARKNDIEPQALFKILYLCLIGQEKGPRLGSFIKMIGQERTIDILQNSVRSSLDTESMTSEANKSD
jgi:lysyl-tRNA synthetase class 1